MQLLPCRLSTILICVGAKQIKTAVGSKIYENLELVIHPRKHKQKFANEHNWPKTKLCLHMSSFLDFWSHFSGKTVNQDLSFFIWCLLAVFLKWVASKKVGDTLVYTNVYYCIFATK